MPTARNGWVNIETDRTYFAMVRTRNGWSVKSIFGYDMNMLISSGGGSVRGNAV
jgi:hypothetical protein